MKELFGALAKAQSEFPEIRKEKTAKAGSFSYKYADIGDIIKAVTETLFTNDLVLTFKSQPHAGFAEVLSAVLAHTPTGQTITSSSCIPTQSDAQDLGSWKTYLKRYCACEVLGIQADEDKDGDLASKGRYQASENKKPFVEKKAPPPSGKPSPIKTAKEEIPTESVELDVDLPKMPMVGKVSIPGYHHGKTIDHLTRADCEHLIKAAEADWKKDKTKCDAEVYKTCVPLIRNRLKSLSGSATDSFSNFTG